MGILNLLAKVGVDISGYERGMHKMGEITKETTNDIKSKIGAIFSFAATEESIRRTVEYAVRIKDLSEQYRMSTDAVQKLDAAAKKVGLTFEDFERVIAKGMNPFDPHAVEQIDEMGPKAYKLKAALEELQRLGPIPLISKEDIEAIDRADKLLSRIEAHYRSKIAHGLGDVERVSNPENRFSVAYGLLGIAGQLNPLAGPAARSLQELLKKNFPEQLGIKPRDDEADARFGFPPEHTTEGDPEDPHRYIKRHREIHANAPNLLVDDLARIGGFSTGTDNGVRSILQQQLAAQLAIEENTKQDTEV